MTITLVWFRNDLRTLDHEPLYHAAAQGHVVPVYCFDPRHFGKTDTFGFAKTGVYRAQFLLEGVADLNQRLTALGTPLVIRMGKPEEVLPVIIKEVGATHIAYHTDVGHDEAEVEKAVAHAMQGLAITPQVYWGQTLYHPKDLPFPIQGLSDLFTNFRKQVEERTTIRTPFPAPTTLQGATLASDPLPTLAQLGLETPTPDPRIVLPFTGGESVGLARLHQYIWEDENLRSYKETRNGMLGESYSSKFSAWLAQGALSPRTIYERVTQYEQERLKNESTYWLIFELLWRDYFRFVMLKYGNVIFQVGGLRDMPIAWQQEPALFNIWCEGRTGYPLVDANMRELAATGFMSNRGRQNVASFLTKNLGLDWRLGAEWFESMLIDYDVANNYGNWNYIAGVGNDPRNFRYFNIIKQAQDYDPQGEYVKQWLPELAELPEDKVHTPSELTIEEQEVYGVKIGVDYPAYIVPLYESAQESAKRYRQAIENVKKRSALEKTPKKHPS